MKTSTKIYIGAGLIAATGITYLIINKKNEKEANLEGYLLMNIDKIMQKYNLNASGEDDTTKKIDDLVTKMIYGNIPIVKLPQNTLDELNKRALEIGLKKPFPWQKDLTKFLPFGNNNLMGGDHLAMYIIDEKSMSNPNFGFRTRRKVLYDMEHSENFYTKYIESKLWRVRFKDVDEFGLKIESPVKNERLDGRTRYSYALGCFVPNGKHKVYKGNASASLLTTEGEQSHTIKFLEKASVTEQTVKAVIAAILFKKLTPSTPLDRTLNAKELEFQKFKKLMDEITWK
jgi:hypothetical protein